MYAKSYLFINITSYNNKLKTVAYPPLKELKVGQKMTNYVIPIWCTQHTQNYLTFTSRKLSFNQMAQYEVLKSKEKEINGTNL